MTRRKCRLLAAAAVVATVASGLSIGLSSSTALASTKLKPLLVGVYTDVTGLGASGNATTVQGVQAAVPLAKRAGYDLKYVVGDTTSSVTGGLSAGQSLVEQHHVFAVIADSSLTFAAAPFFKAQGIPVIGAAEDSTEWQTDDNMFSVYGAIHTNLVSTTFGEYMKSQGVTTVGAAGYDIAPSASEAAEGAGVSAKKVGLKAGYIDPTVTYGTVDMDPIALAMKAAGVNGITASVDPNTADSLIADLKLYGVHLKAVLLPTGYGGDVTNQATPAELQALQGVSFELPYEPIEMNTSATKQFAADLKSAGVKGLPTEAEYNGYESVGLLLQGLKGAGSNPTQASLIKALSKIHNWNALGMWGGRTMDINNRTGIIDGVDNCTWVGKLEGSKFDLVPGAEPICGKTIAGVSVSPPNG